ncbi:unnamed protein product [Candida verbasci]|uniref:Endonuclease/exonuclease/phosphatase domain-containing protein n=1 Tax=Candida verbasci TaxID=1227364 RepID=A0A9W4TSA8_9ASCO|nr:unnamed protein product [Candida verbasci]
MDEILSNVPLKSIKSKELGDTRFITFNVNGLKTLFNYHPWNKFNSDLNEIFKSLQSDIITLQELKLTESSLSSLKDIGHLKDYKSFISLPSLKKGYSGVGLFVKNNIGVIKAEEGITGHLANKKGVSYRANNGIGGYPNVLEEEGIYIDSQGRCVIIELVDNSIIFALYCPANSSGTEDGEEYRIRFLSLLLERCQNLYKLGKEVVVMGDINVAIDLIDSAEGIKGRLMSNLITQSDNNFEIINYEECCKFKESTPARKLMNKYVIRTLWQDISEKEEGEQFLYDTTRFIQGRRMKMYTVWNTIKNSRSINFGSRIDLILATEKLIGNVTHSDIMQNVQGSDHCPVYTDFKLKLEGPNENLPFEAKNHYKLNKTRDIMTLFGKKKDSTPSEDSNSNETTPIETETQEATPAESKSKEESIPIAPEPSSKPKLVYRSRKEPPKKKQKVLNIQEFYSK